MTYISSDGTRPTPDELVQKMRTLTANQVLQQLEEDYKVWTLDSRYSSIVAFIRMCETQPKTNT